MYNECNIENKIRMNYRNLTQLLISRHLTITTMESATSGQIASLITDTEGSSAVLKGAFITYCNEAKIMQGVPAEIIDKYTVYSKETAGSMAQVCRKAYNANIGIGVTGTMGNVDPANPDASIPGQVYFAIDISWRWRRRYMRSLLRGWTDRTIIKGRINAISHIRHPRRCHIIQENVEKDKL